MVDFEISRVASSFMVITMLEDRVMEGVIIWDIYSSFVGENTSLVLPVGEMRVKGRRDGSVHRLEGLEYKWVVGRGRLYSIRKGRVDDVDEERRRE